MRTFFGKKGGLSSMRVRMFLQEKRGKNNITGEFCKETVKNS